MVTTPDRSPSERTPEPHPEAWVERVLDVMVYAPVGLAVQLRTDVPRLVADGRAHVESRVKVARWVGEMAVHFGARQLSARLHPPVAAPLSPSAAPEPPVPAAPADPPFESYDNLAAAQIVQLLPRLPHVELQMVREYEAGGRRRRTILAKIDQLLG